MTQADSPQQEITITQMSRTDVEPLCERRRSDPDEYSQYFIPFEFTTRVFQDMLANAKLDRFFCVNVSNLPVGFYMLRGMDEGYPIPAYGVWISSRYAGYGLATLTLYHALAFCRLNKYEQIMLKVHPENLRAKRIYEKCGFLQTGKDPKNQNLIYHKTLER